MNFQIESATKSGSDTNLVFVLHISSHVVRKKTAQVIYSSTVTSSEVQEQVEVEDNVPSRSIITQFTNDTRNLPLIQNIVSTLFTMLDL